jgi:hypothetical protein
MNLEQSPISDDLLDQLARRFEWHAQNIYGVSSINSSPLYAQLSSEIATDPAILSLVAAADSSQEVSNLLLGAVHFLLLSGIASPLADYYPSLSPHPRPRHEAYTYFRAFCLEHADTIRHLVTTQRVQTNEVQHGHDGKRLGKVLDGLEPRGHRCKWIHVSGIQRRRLECESPRVFTRK